MRFERRANLAPSIAHFAFGDAVAVNARAEIPLDRRDAGKAFGVFQCRPAAGKGFSELRTFCSVSDAMTLLFRAARGEFRQTDRAQPRVRQRALAASTSRSNASSAVVRKREVAPGLPATSTISPSSSGVKRMWRCDRVAAGRPFS